MRHQQQEVVASLRAVLLVAAALAAVGAVVALAAFVLFRAGQILLGNENPSGTVTGATGLFLLAFLGLVSGLRAKDVIDQLEAGFFRVFPRESGAKIEARAEEVVLSRVCFRVPPSFDPGAPAKSRCEQGAS